MTKNLLWQTKLHARLHDPAEKALVLMRDPAGHEGGNSRVLWRMARHDQIPTDQTLSNDNAGVLHAVAFAEGIKPDTYKTVQRADWWAAAADRPQWPCEEITVTQKNGEKKTIAVAPWARVQWANKPILLHPLTGEAFDLKTLTETEFEDIKGSAFDHLSQLLIRHEGVTDYKKTLLAMWRFGPELFKEESDNGRLGALWHLLPADTRIPDHSIWDHLDLTSAFAGAFAADEQGDAALLSLAIGPVQPFIASARKMDDLWAGSHLLASLSWEAMRVICERLGPDAILFPRLRGIPQVDVWLRDQMGLPDSWFRNCDWKKGSTDSNPLFSAALPNRFVAIVPASQAKTLAEAVKTAVREWLQALGKEVVDRLLEEAGYGDEKENLTIPHEQMKEQLADFPEVHWAAVPFSLIRCKDPQKQKDLDTTGLSEAMKPFFEGNGEPGFLGTPAWKILQKELSLMDEQGKKSTFFAPNPGVLYPAVYDLAERVLAAAKSLRPYHQTRQQGWRCTLTGETEWLTTDRAQLHWTKTERQEKGTLWTRIANQKPAWAKAGEHLGALPAIKRLWPTLFAEEVEKRLGLEGAFGRFVVSTHTMALAHQISNVADSKIPSPIADELLKQERVAMPRKLAKALHNAPDGDLKARIPGWLDAVREKAQTGTDSTEIDRVQKAIAGLFGSKPEAYYGLLLMDGDKMGAILSGDASTDTTISYRSSFHPQLRSGFDGHATQHPLIKQYGQQKRALSPNRHLAISGALNDFSLTVARHVVEEEYLGRLIYAGGDDVFAMLPVVDLLPAMQRLRYAYSGTLPDDSHKDWGELQQQPNALHCKAGFAWLNGKLMRMMGEKATASCGAVIAHHQAPLSAVRRELQNAEKRAKTAGGRDAFSLAIIKRSGGALYFTDRWGESLTQLIRVRDFLTQDGVSRRAVYHTLAWLDARSLPANAIESGQLKSLLHYQLIQQSKGADPNAQGDIQALAAQLEVLALGWRQQARQQSDQQPESRAMEKLRNFLSVAEFLARETRAEGEDK